MARGFRLALIAALMTVAPADFLSATPVFRLPQAVDDLSTWEMTAVEEGPVGFLWFGTADGLYRYDGYEFVPVGADIMRDDHVTALESGYDGDLWIGARDGGIYRYDARTWTVSEVIAGSRERTDAIQAIAVGSDGVVRAGSATRGLLFLDQADFSTERLSYDPLLRPSLTSPSVYRLVVDAAGFTYAASRDRGLSIISPDRSSVRALLPGGATTIRDIVSHGPGAVLIATDRGIIRHEREAGIESVVSSEVVDRLLLMGEEIWAVQGASIVRIDAGSGSVRRVAEMPSRVRDLHYDRSGSIWAATSVSGPFQAVLRHADFAVPQSPDPAFVSAPVLSLAEAPDGGILVGTDHQGIQRYDPPSGRLETWFVPRAGESVSPVVSLTASESLVAVALERAGALLLEAAVPPRVVASVQTVASSVLLTDGHLIVGTDGYGLLDLSLGSDPGSATPVRVAGRVTALAHADGGRVWVGTDRAGLYRYNPRDGSLARFEHPLGNAAGVSVQAIEPQGDGTIVVSARAGGVARLDLQTDAVHWLVRPSQLGVELVQGAAVDSAGMAWLATNKGLVRSRPNDMQQRTYTAADGLPSDRISAGALLRARDGSIVAGTRSGLVRLDPTGIRANSYEPRVVFSALSLDGGEPVPWNGSTGAGDAASLTIPPHADGFLAAVSGLDFSDSDSVVFEYELSSIEGTVTGTTDRIIAHDGLLRGQYELVVRATNADGLTSRTPARLLIEVEPNFWETRSFIVLAILAVGGIVGIALRMGLARAEEQRRALQNAVDRRTADLEASKHALEQEVASRRKMERALHEIQAELEQRVAHRTNALEQANALLAREVNDRREAQERSADALAQNQALLQEIHHRVKNNMQVISSLLSLQAGTISDDAARQGFMTSRERIGAMALIHDRLYHGESFANVDMGEYFNQLAKSLAGLHGRSVRVESIARAVSLDIAVATPCGLITNELVTNAMKHAFAEPTPPDALIRIELVREGDAHLLRVADNGRGIAAGEAAMSQSNHGSLGMRIVEVLVSQIDGALEMRTGYDTRLGRGTEFEVRF